MTEREKIIALLDQCAEPDGDFGIDNAIAFFHAAQKEAFEQAALICEDSLCGPYEANRIRQLIKE